MKKWLGLLIIATFSCCTMNVFADNQSAPSSLGTVSAAQPVTMPQVDPAQAPVAVVVAAPVVEVKVPIDFGDYRSSTLVSKAWAALANNDIESVLAYTNKCISLYAKRAGKMQAGLRDYAFGPNDAVFKYWALNDVATSYFIQGEAYRAANMKDEAKAAYNKLLSDYSFGQCWDLGISEFSSKDEFKPPMTPEGLIKDIQTSGINVPVAGTSIKSLNKLLEDKALYKAMAGRSDEAKGLIDRLEQGQRLSIADIKELNRSLLETNYPANSPVRKGWFWRPADAAKEKLDMMERGVNWDFGDYKSSTLVQKAWTALAAHNLQDVEAYVNETMKLYGGRAKDMQASLKDYASGDNDTVFSYWALNDVGTALFILGQAYQNADKKDDAAKVYKRIINEFSYAQCWDPQGWFWHPADAAQQKLGELDNA